jgi:uncharacterized protein (UPF0371 family)
MAPSFRTRPEPAEEPVDVNKPFALIGQLKVENDFLKRVAGNCGYEYPTEIGVHEIGYAIAA